MIRVTELIHGYDMTLQGALSRGSAGLVPCLNFNGATYANVNAHEFKGLTGFTVGGWFYTTLTTGTFVSCWYPAANQIWRLTLSGTKPTFGISTTGANEITVQHPVAIVANTWNFIAARFTPSNDITIWVNDIKTTLVAGIPASLFNTDAAPLIVGAESGGAVWLTGSIAMLWFSNQAIEETYLASLYDLGKTLFQF